MSLKLDPGSVSTRGLHFFGGLSGSVPLFGNLFVPSKT